MITTIPMPKPLTFDEWIKESPYLATLEIQCRNCNGTGNVEYFNYGKEMECETCDGSGVVNGAKILYKEQIEKDKKLWQKAMVTNGNL